MPGRLYLVFLSSALLDLGIYLLVRAPRVQERAGLGEAFCGINVGQFMLFSTSFMAGLTAGLVHLGKSLVLTDEDEGKLVLSEEAWRAGVEAEGSVLVGRLLTPRPYRFDVLKLMLNNLLRPIKEMSIRLLENQCFLLCFNHRVDRDRALDGCPWTFDKNLIILNKVNANENPLDVDLNGAPSMSLFMDCHCV
ncbi:UNVERIFIED_CONTAM: hypothetical protein Slati_3383300 [Sesamum latifolium]|uniref:DUF4283 domain-containing protein n=1 Tax=Sesamum latifolium TaxID=2727402 RepID=A0AAW2UEY5_9LAMI